MIFEIIRTSEWRPSDTPPCSNCLHKTVPAAKHEYVYGKPKEEQLVRIWLVGVRTIEDLQRIRDEVNCELIVFADEQFEYHGYPVIEIYDSYRE